MRISDWSSDVCSSDLGTLAKLIEEDPQLRVVMKEFPILSQQSATGAHAALAALRQGKYEAFHFALMEGGGGLSQMEILAVADSVGLDSERLPREMQDPQIPALLRRNTAPTRNAPGRAREGKD